MKDPWRYQCPRGHCTWRGGTTRDGYYCDTCQRNGHDPWFDRLIDAKTEQPVVKP